jgi:hypothetical protein
MNIARIKDLWPVAKLLHEARRDAAWGKAGKHREPFPEFTTAYTHNPIAYVDLALAQAEALLDHGFIEDYHA